MITGVPKHLLVSGLSEALLGFGLERSVESDHANGVELFIRVRVGNDDVSVVTESTDSPEDRARAVKAAESLSKRKDVKCAVAVCYAYRYPHQSTEETRYVWRVIHKPEQDSESMTGGVADLALTVMLAPADPREPGDAARALAENLSEFNADTLVRAIPIAGATNQTFADTRRLLARTYRLDFLVASHEGTRAGFSGTGKKREVLLICRPRASARESMSATRAINLAQNPSTTGDARAIATHIKQHIEFGDESVRESGSVQRVDYTELHDGDWGAVHFLSPLLRCRFLQLKHGDIIHVTTLGAVAELNQTGSSVRRAFTQDHSIAKGMRKYKAFWGHDSDSARTMRVKAETRIWVRPGKIASADVCWKRGSRLLLPEQPYLPSVGAIAVRLDESNLGSMWTNCSIRQSYRQPEEYEKALCVYLNSTLGILAMLGGSTRRADPKRLWPTVKDYKSLPVPDFGSCGDALKALAAAFDEFRDRALSPLSQLDTCPERSSIDNAVGMSLGIGEDLVRSIREHLVAEPVVAGESDASQELPQVERQEPLFNLCRF